MFTVEINNLKVKTKIGISKKERKKTQLLLVSLKFNYNISKKVNANNIKYLKDYSTIIKFLKNYIKKSENHTLENLILDCIKKLKKDFKLKNISLVINKIDVAKKYGCDSISVSQ
tara:strand:- start:285 stop:629 length:345 start_codon:yes stop_codon:yes gene_type:complete